MHKIRFGMQAHFRLMIYNVVMHGTWKTGAYLHLTMYWATANNIT